MLKEFAFEVGLLGGDSYSQLESFSRRIRALEAVNLECESLLKSEKHSADKSLKTESDFIFKALDENNTNA